MRVVAVDVFVLIVCVCVLVCCLVLVSFGVCDACVLFGVLRFLCDSFGLHCVIMWLFVCVCCGCAFSGVLALYVIVVWCVVFGVFVVEV